jgi:hypothetical protein
MNHSTCRIVATAALALAGMSAWATGPGKGPATSTDAGHPSKSRWTAELVEERNEATKLVIHDRVHNRRYRLSDFEGAPVERVHWLSPAYLEVDFPDHVALLHVRAASHADEPTFHLVMTEFNTAGAGRIDYYSPPLVAHNHKLAVRQAKAEENP